MTKQMNSNPTKREAVLLTCYMTGSTSGKNLGTPGYSYDFVAKLYEKLLSGNREVIPVPQPKLNLEKAAADARARGLSPVHVSILPFQDVHMCKTAPNVVIPAWEFPDIPDHEFDSNPRNNWVAMANKTDLVLVGGQFTVESMRRGGVTSPIQIVQVPTPDGYFAVSPWDYNKQTTVNCRAYWPRAAESEQFDEVETRKSCFKDAKRAMTQSVRAVYKAVLGPARYQAISDRMKSRRNDRRRKRAGMSTGPDVLFLNYPSTSELQLSGVVYTSIFNPDDGRKNWADLISAFLLANGDREDATLVLKLITRRREGAEQVIRYYQEIDIPHRCKVAFVVDYLSDETLHQLASASTYYLQTTRAEGNCLPLMNYLAAGRPGISPNHSAMGDYFNDSYGWVVQSHQEPASWPHDSRLRYKTSWGRLVWTSCRDSIRDSYDFAIAQQEQYQSLSRRCRNHMQQWASEQAVGERINLALDQLRDGKLKPMSEQGPVLLKFPHANGQAGSDRAAA